jgi:hypothetical protein
MALDIVEEEVQVEYKDIGPQVNISDSRGKISTEIPLEYG